LILDGFIRGSNSETQIGQISQIEQRVLLLGAGGVAPRS
jgi:hypothetical protein